MNVLPSSAPVRPVDGAKALLDTPADSVFDWYTKLAAQIFNVPVALISVLDERRQFFKSQVGLPSPWAELRETPLSLSFCRHVAASRKPMIFENARESDMMKDNPAVTHMGIVAYAGAPMFDEDGSVYGALCAVDTKPRQWSEDDIEVLRALAEQATSEVALGEKLAKAGMEHPCARPEPKDFRASLHTVLQAMTSIQRSGPLTPDQKDSADRAIQGAEEMLRMIGVGEPGDSVSRS